MRIITETKKIRVKNFKKKAKDQIMKKMQKKVDLQEEKVKNVLKSQKNPLALKHL